MWPDLEESCARPLYTWTSRTVFIVGEPLKVTQQERVMISFAFKYSLPAFVENGLQWGRSQAVRQVRQLLL